MFFLFNAAKLLSEICAIAYALRNVPQPNIYLKCVKSQPFYSATIIKFFASFMSMPRLSRFERVDASRFLFLGT